jgi:hypothetical protein
LSHPSPPRGSSRVGVGRSVLAGAVVLVVAAAALAVLYGTSVLGPSSLAASTTATSPSTSRASSSTSRSYSAITYTGRHDPVAATLKAWFWRVFERRAFQAPLRGLGSSSPSPPPESRWSATSRSWSRRPRPPLTGPLRSSRNPDSPMKGKVKTISLRDIFGWGRLNTKPRVLGNEGNKGGQVRV